MPIKKINEDIWSEILKVQAEAYSQIEPESLEVLKSKWLRSPESCFVYEKSGEVVGYLLAHSWNSEVPPKLFKTLPVGTEGTVLFLHDLAISSAGEGDGLGRKMVAHLLKIAKGSGFQQVRLVSVQDSVEFWKKQGFAATANHELCSSYGEDAQLMIHNFSA
uniref:GNAT family N-acetyltransferase n=1 Tax=Marinobacterium profundum TaxID=1714300 RepID=UPI000833A52E|nr:GNAT family N-acetyltransferase [Marinobacterium profundum]